MLLSDPEELSRGVSDASSEGCEALFGEVLFDSSGEGASLLPFPSEEVVRFSAYAFVGFAASKLNATAGVLVKTRQKVKTPTSTSRAFSLISMVTPFSDDTVCFLCILRAS